MSEIACLHQQSRSATLLSGVYTGMPNVVSHLKFAVAVILLSQVALACIMTPRPPTKIRGTRIEGRFTYEGKPLSRSKVELRTASGRLLRTTTTDKNGGYRLAGAGGGLFQIRPLNQTG